MCRNGQVNETSIIVPSRVPPVEYHGATRSPKFTELHTGQHPAEKNMESTPAESAIGPSNERTPVRSGPKLYVGHRRCSRDCCSGPDRWPRIVSRPRPVSAATPMPIVVVSQPMEKDLHGRLQFLGQFSPVDQVELRAQVGGALEADRI